MWKLALTLSLISAPSFAAGLIQVPADAVVRPNASPSAGAPRAPGMGTSVLTDLFTNGPASGGSQPLPDWLTDGASAENYAHFVNTMVYYTKQRAMAEKAVKIPPVAGVHCLPHPDAFGFERVNELEYKMNCFAGPGKKITHIAEYHMKITFDPQGCATEAKVRDFFASAANRTRRAAREFFNVVNSTCMVQAFPVNPGAAVVSVAQLGPNFDIKSVPGKQELDKYVNGPQAGRREPQADHETVANERPARRERRPVAEDDEEEKDSRPEPRPTRSFDDAACRTNGVSNPFCSHSAN